jgi:tetratricopeptide (TPR) repeat protein
MNNVPGEVRAIKGLISVAETRKDRVGQIDNLLLLARTMNQGGDREGAVNAYRKVNEIDPLNDEAKGFLERAEPGQVQGEDSEITDAVIDETAEDENLIEIEALEETEEAEFLDVQEIEFEDISVDGVDDEVEVVEIDEPEELESEDTLDLEDDEALIEFVEDEGVEEDADESVSPLDDTADNIFLEDHEDDDLVLEIPGETPEDLAPADIPVEPVTDESEPQVEEMSLEELLAEIDVYERYGLGEKAVETLERARSMAPQDQRVLDRIAAFESRQQPDVIPSTDDVPVREVEPEPDTGQDSFAEDLEEADFYHSQGLDDEALRIYKSILTRDPQHQRAMQAIDIIEGKGGGGEPVEPDIPLEIPDDLQPAAPAETFAPVDAPVEPTAVNQPPFEGIAGVHHDAAPADPAPGFEAPVESAPESFPEAGDAAGPSSEPALGSQFSPESSREVKSKLIVEDSTPEDMGGFLDLADELRSELADEIEIDTGSADTDGPVSFEDIFSQFKKGIEETLGDEEYETHYNLGIAYKDMGLHDDAIREFEAGTRDPDLAQDSYSLMAMCYVEKKEYESAVKAIEHALGVSNEGSRTGLFYQLGEVREKQKKWSEAASAYEQVKVGDPSFQGIEEAIQRVKASITDTASGEEPEDLSAEEGVDDMLADLIREVEEMAMESSDESPDDPGKIKKDRISYL